MASGSSGSGPSGGFAGSANKQLLLALVARGTTILAEHAIVAGNAGLIAVRILEKLGSEDTRVSVSQERYMFHILVQGGLTFLVMCDEAAGRRLPFAFLDEVKTRFVAQFGAAAASAAAYEMNQGFAPVLSERMSFYSNDPSADTLGRVKGELGEVKNIMIQNIEKVLDRGEKLDLLVGKADDLSTTAMGFRREARRLRRTFWWQNARMWFVAAGGTLALLYFILALTCGPTLRGC